jgi:hypothetical protein
VRDRWTPTGFGDCETSAIRVISRFTSSSGDTGAPQPSHGVSSKKVTTLSDGILLYAVGKRAAGRRLDGDTWDELPIVET